MPVTHPTATRNATVDFVVDRVDVGTTNPSGRLYFQTSADADICFITCQLPAFGSASAGVASMAGVPLTSSAAAGNATVAKAQFRNRNDTAEINCAVSTSGSDINLSGVSLGPGDTIRIDALTYSIP